MKRKTHRRIALLTALALSLCVVCTACRQDRPPEESDPAGIEGTRIDEQDVTGKIETGYSRADLDDSEDAEGTVEIHLADDGTTVEGEGAGYENGTLIVRAGGVYRLTGELTDGQILVAAGAEEKVRLILAGVSLRCESDAAIFAESADKVILTLAAGTQNTVTDADTRTPSDDDARCGAAIYGAVSITVNGSGSLKVTAGYKNGIGTKKALKIVGGTLEIDAANAGLKGNNSVSIRGGEIDIRAVGDGIKTEETENTAKGFIAVDSGRVTITAEGDGMASSQYLLMCGGTVNVTTTGETGSPGGQGGGGRSPGGFPDRGGFPGGDFGGKTTQGTTSDGVSSKGLKAETLLLVNGGEITVGSTGHCLHSKGDILIGGDVVMTLSSSAGKGVSAHGNLQIDGGRVLVSRATEGLEAKAFLTVNGGEISITASDDGMNAGGTSESATGMVFNGGYTVVNAGGDGLDSNGNIAFNGGVVVVAGPTSGGDGPLDCGERSQIYCNGGVMVAYGSIFQANADNPSADSTQGSLRVSLSASAGNTVTLRDGDGAVILTVTLEKTISNIYISAPDLKVGETYTLSTGGTNTATAAAGGLTLGGEVSGDRTAVSVTLDSVFGSNMATGGGGFPSIPGGDPWGGGNPGGPGGPGGMERPGGRR